MSVDVAGLALTIRDLQATIGAASMRVRMGDLPVADILLLEAQRLALVCERECEAVGTGRADRNG